MSYTGIFDTHAHYDDSWFDEDRDNTLSFIKESGVSAVINCSCDYKSSLTTLALSEKYDFIYAALGVHPECSKEIILKDTEIIKPLYDKQMVVAVGEIGLDYHYDETPRELQKEVFEKQIILAKELDLPIIVHDREAHEDTMEILKKYKPKGVLHCFSGSTEMAKEIIKLGMYIGLGGVVTFKNARKSVEVAEMLPVDCLLLETDCPYMAPVPFRGKRCDSSLIAYTAEFIANLKRIEAQTLIDVCNSNAKSLFNIK